ncbi:Extracellular Matrix protein PelC [hydrothermal vent metagenome]|uniref:Extracellular Matrix protein PelC n=1 Tax=hydrothermal vent metagenome TaxID=652676 RepID=A0A1W1D3P9_9ZZZZ
MSKIGLVLMVIFFVSGCSTSTITVTENHLPKVYKDHNETHEIKRKIKISLFRLNNYTDTPKAGLRAANILEGVLRSKGYIVKTHIKKKYPTIKQARKQAKKDKSHFFMYGGVSEWRYKTGIDGEPAVSVQLSLYKTKNGKLKWSASGSDSDWGNGSIGTTAQDLFEDMLRQ